VHGDDVAALGEPTLVKAWADDAPTTNPVAVVTAQELGDGKLSFDASQSRAASDATYEWLFSDGTTVTGVAVTHDFGAAPHRWATVTVTDSSGTDFAGASIDGPNQAPQAADDTFTLAKDVTLDQPAPGILANDSDADEDLLWPQVVNHPLHGTLDVTANGAFTYTPDTGFEGIDRFTYRASDGTGASDPATVTLLIGTPPPDPTAPSITSSAPPTTGANGVGYNFTFTASGNPPPTFTVSTGSLPVGLSLSPDGVLSGTPTTSWTWTFTITAANATGVAEAGPFSIQVSSAGTPSSSPSPSPSPSSSPSPSANPSPSTLVSIGDLALAKPKLKGKATVGKKLRVVHPTGLPQGWKVAYQWLRSGKPIKGKAAKRATYKIPDEDRGKKLTVRLVYTAPGFKPWKVTTPVAKKVG
jgi:hypothetical protein